MKCTLCPRECGVDRHSKRGYCGASDKIVVSRTMLHMWEEPCISGTRGSGAIFFSGCNLRCVYCQNIDISHKINGEELDARALADKMLKLQSQGAHNINLVTPTPYVMQIKEAIDMLRGALKIPIVYNTSGYESVETIRALDGYVDIFLCDIKYYDSALSLECSGAEDYYERAISALDEMLKIAPNCTLDGDGIMTKGVILRHLVLPSHRDDSIKILEDVCEKFDISRLKLSLMSQYTPDFYVGEIKALKRKITTFEYQCVTDRAIALGYDGYIQDRESATKSYTPSFKKGDKNEA
ncbi:MAG: radical SAM protein [Clostridia bacterium]|nr:radical SAM protein [Clostridia bacterium]